MAVARQPLQFGTPCLDALLMQGLALEQGCEQLLRRRRVVAIPFKLSDELFLLGDMGLAIGNVPLCLSQVIEDLRPVHDPQGRTNTTRQSRDSVRIKGALRVERQGLLAEVAARRRAGDIGAPGKLGGRQGAAVHERGEHRCPCGVAHQSGNLLADASILDRIANAASAATKDGSASAEPFARDKPGAGGDNADVRRTT